jgi:hypothetical protein
VTRHSEDATGAEKSGGDNGDDGDGGDDEDDGGRFDWPESSFDRVLFVLSFPWLCLFTVTIPDVENEKWENW